MNASRVSLVALVLGVGVLGGCSSSNRSGGRTQGGADSDAAAGQTGAGGSQQQQTDSGLISGISGSSSTDSDASPASGGTGGASDSDAAAGGGGGSNGDPLSFNEPVAVATYPDCDGQGDVAVSPGFIYFTCYQTVGDGWITRLFRVPRSALSASAPVTPDALLSLGPEPPPEDFEAAFDFLLLGATDDGAAVALSGYVGGTGWLAGAWMPAGASSANQLFAKVPNEEALSEDNWYFANNTVYEAYRSYGSTPGVRFAGESLPGITPGTHFETELALDCHGYASGVNDTHAFFLLDCADGAQLYGGNVNTSVEPMSEPVVLVITDNRLFATDEGDMLITVTEPESSIGIWSFPTDGGTPMRVSETPAIGFEMFAVSGNLAVGYGSSTLFAIPLDGSATTIPIADDVARPNSMAADAEGAYWVGLSPAGATLFAATH